MRGRCSSLGRGCRFAPVSHRDHSTGDTFLTSLLQLCTAACCGSPCKLWEWLHPLPITTKHQRV